MPIPLGVWMGRSWRAKMVFSPILDALQTIPSLVYIIPAGTLFTVGGGAHGLEMITAVKRSDVGLGFEVGLSIVVVILDRLTKSIGAALPAPAA